MEKGREKKIICISNYESESRIKNMFLDENPNCRKYYIPNFFGIFEEVTEKDIKSFTAQYLVKPWKEG